VVGFFLHPRIGDSGKAVKATAEIVRYSASLPENAAVRRRDDMMRTASDAGEQLDAIMRSVAAGLKTSAH